MIIPFNLTATNEFGNSMVLTGQTPEFLVEYSGFDAPQMNMMSIDLYNMDGAMYQGSKAQPRSIILDAYIFNHVTFWRTKLYETFIAGKEVTLRYEKDGNVRIITGVVDKITTPQFEQQQRGRQNVQISLVCYDPWWKAPERNIVQSVATSYGETSNLTFNIPYDGDIETGFTVEFALSRISTFIYPTVQLVDGQGNEGSFILDCDELEVYDYVYVDSADKKVYGKTTTALSEYNLIHFWKRDNQWLKLTKGDNIITVSGRSDGGTLIVKVYYNELYQGV